MAFVPLEQLEHSNLGIEFFLGHSGKREALAAIGALPLGGYAPDERDRF